MTVQLGCRLQSATFQRQLIFFVFRSQAGNNLNLHMYIFFLQFSPVCRPWQVPPGAACSPRTPLATHLIKKVPGKLEPNSAIQINCKQGAQLRVENFRLFGDIIVGQLYAMLANVRRPYCGHISKTKQDRSKLTMEQTYIHTDRPTFTCTRQQKLAPICCVAAFRTQLPKDVMGNILISNCKKMFTQRLLFNFGATPQLL